MEYMGSVEANRGGVVESTHHFIACASDPFGRILMQGGDPATQIFLRSAAKPMIAATVIRSGAIERFGLTEEEIAIMAGSHLGASIHVNAVKSMLEKIGCNQADLHCGPVFPGDEQVAAALQHSGAGPERVYNNCSGKHAGILAMARCYGETERYWEREHPAQRAIAQMYARIFGMQVENFIYGIDGCGIPVIALPLHNATMGVARFATTEGLDDTDAHAVRVVRDAMIAHPEYVRAQDGFDTQVMHAARGHVFAKSGAEGVFSFGELTRGFGCVLKICDGGARALPVAAAVCLTQLEVPLEPWFLERFASAEIRNTCDEIVGEMRARV
jgi:L-asparaginase II